MGIYKLLSCSFCPCYLVNKDCFPPERRREKLDPRQLRHLVERLTRTIPKLLTCSPHLGAELGEGMTESAHPKLRMGWDEEVGSLDSGMRTGVKKKKKQQKPDSCPHQLRRA